MLFNGNGPRSQSIHLAEDTGSDGGIEQAVSVEASAIPDTPADTSVVAPTEEYFHTMTIPGDNGEDEVLNFKDPKELSDRYMQNRFRRADYTKKTQELSSQRKGYERDMDALRAKETSLTNLSNKYSEFDGMFADVNAQQMKQIADQVRGVTEKQTPEMKELNNRLQAIEKKEQAEQKRVDAESRKNRDSETFESKGRYLKTHYDDYEHEGVMKAYEQLNSAEPEMAHQAILEMLYFANKGKGSQAKPEDPQGPPRTKTAGRNVGAPTKPMTIREAKQAAIKDLA